MLYSNATSRPFARLQDSKSCNRYALVVAQLTKGITRKLGTVPFHEKEFPNPEAQDDWIAQTIGWLATRHMSDDNRAEPLTRHLLASLVLSNNKLKLNPSKVSPLMATIVYIVRLVVMRAFSHYMESVEGQEAKQYVFIFCWVVNGRLQTEWCVVLWFLLFLY